MRIGAFVCAVLTAVTAMAPAFADLRDVAAASSGETGHVWLMFDEAPGAVDAAMTGTGLQLDVSGVTVRQRVIAPYDVSMVSTITVTPTQAGARIFIADEVGWSSARAEIVDGAVLVTIGLPDTQVQVGGEAWPGAAPVPSAAAGADEADADAAAPVTHAAPGEDFAPRPRPARQEDTAPVDAVPAPAEAETGAPASSGETAPHGTDTPAVAAAATDACAGEAAAVEADPWDDDSLHAHAACLTGAGELDAAAAIYEQMLAFAPENFRALIALAELREAQGETAAAQDLYNQAAAHALSDAEAARARARLRELRNN